MPARDSESDDADMRGAGQFNGENSMNRCARDFRGDSAVRSRVATFGMTVCLGVVALACAGCPGVTAPRSCEAIANEAGVIAQGEINEAAICRASQLSLEAYDANCEGSREGVTRAELVTSVSNLCQ
jgi:hypothetical protein